MCQCSTDSVIERAVQCNCAGSSKLQTYANNDRNEHSFATRDVYSSYSRSKHCQRQTILGKFQASFIHSRMT